MTILTKTQSIVRAVLETCPEARDNDMLLYYRVCEKINTETLSMPFGLVIVNLKQYELPNLETVGRTRRKLQADNPHLRGTESTQRRRRELEDEFRDYARSV